MSPHVHYNAAADGQVLAVGRKDLQKLLSIIGPLPMEGASNQYPSQSSGRIPR
jgi:hypothetical protein